MHEECTKRWIAHQSPRASEFGRVGAACHRKDLRAFFVVLLVLRVKCLAVAKRIRSVYYARLSTPGVFEELIDPA